MVTREKDISSQISKEENSFNYNKERGYIVANKQRTGQNSDDEKIEKGK